MKNWIRRELANRKKILLENLHFLGTLKNFTIIFINIMNSIFHSISYEFNLVNIIFIVFKSKKLKNFSWN